MKSNTGLAEYAKAQLGRPYWYGTFGQIAASGLYLAKLKQYPNYYKHWNDFADQFGMKVHDCIGLIKGYLWSDNPNDLPVYNVNQDISANGMREKCRASDDMDAMPDTVGILVFTAGHVGVYIGGGKVIEAAGHQYGVIMTDINDRRLGGYKAKAWTHWGYCPWISYGEKVMVKSGTWNVRRGIGTANKVTAVVNGGEIYSSSKTESGWFFIDKYQGWVSGKGIIVL